MDGPHSPDACSKLKLRPTNRPLILQTLRTDRNLYFVRESVRHKSPRPSFTTSRGGRPTCPAYHSLQWCHVVRARSALFGWRRDPFSGVAEGAFVFSLAVSPVAAYGRARQYPDDDDDVYLQLDSTRLSLYAIAVWRSDTWGTMSLTATLRNKEMLLFLCEWKWKKYKLTRKLTNCNM